MNYSSLTTDLVDRFKTILENTLKEHLKKHPSFKFPNPNNSNNSLTNYKAKKEFLEKENANKFLQYGELLKITETDYFVLE